MKEIVKVTLIFSVLLSLSCESIKKSTKNIGLISPDGQISLLFQIDSIGSPIYEIFYKGEPVLIKSNLGVLFKNTIGFTENLTIISTKKNKDIDTISSMYGKSNYSCSRYNEVEVKLENRDKKIMSIIFRAYDDGIAFRYSFSENKKDKIEIVQENTTFRFKDNYTCWGMKNYNKDFEGDQGKYTINSLESLTSFPITISIKDGPFISITEANLVNYAGMNVLSDSINKNTLLTRLTQTLNDSSISVRSEYPLVSPWRVILIAKEPVGLLESNLILHLNQPSKDDFSWVEPGKAAWTWFSSGSSMKTNEFSGMNNSSIKKYIDFANSQGYKHFLIDAGWIIGQEHDSAARFKVDPFTIVNGINLKELSLYCKEKKMGLGVWMNYVSIKDNYEKIFSWLSEMGVTIAKIDFVSSDDQETVNVVYAIISSAAKNHIMVDLHSIYKPTGLNRTFPNLLTSEGVMGAEYNKWDTVWAEHNLILPFTRMLAGPMDYTPGIFVNVTLDKFKNTFKKDKNGNDLKELDYVQSTQVLNTRAQELAKYIIYESPLQMVSDKPSNLVNQEGLDFINKVPTYWDETIGIDGYPGEFIVLARRKSDEWYIGIMCSIGKKVIFDTDFLKEDKIYTYTIWQDHDLLNKFPGKLTKINGQIKKGETLSIPVSENGGAVVKFYLKE